MSTDWTFIYSLIKPELGGVLAVCWIVGYVLKRTPRVPDWSIIYVVTLVAVIMACLLLGLGAESVIQGVLCGAFAVYGYQLVKQTAKVANGEGNADERK